MSIRLVLNRRPEVKMVVDEPQNRELSVRNMARLVVTDGADTTDATASASDVKRGAVFYGNTGRSVGTMSEYSGTTEVTPGDEDQIIQVGGMYLPQNIVIKKVPSGYGKITYSGFELKVM